MKDPWTVILRPLVTEKTMSVMQKRNTYTFIVAPSSNKIEIRYAVEKAFSVKVDRVRTATVKGKVKMMKNQVLDGRRKNWKKAYVTLKDGYRLDII